MFIMAVLSLIILTNLLVMFALGYADPAGGILKFDWQIFSIITIVVTAVVLGGSLYKINDLSGGGKHVAKSLGGTLVKHDTKVYQERVLLNVVEEMAIAAGTPVPEVYLLREEEGINAFAAGFTTDDAVIGVTQGALDYFTREELQGVIAHEFSHIIHGDMRLNMRIIGILHGILLIGLLGYYILRLKRFSGSRKGGGQIVFLGLGLVVIGYGGTFFGNMIKASISRKREYLADASAVQYTRNNRGIADALIKIGGYSKGSNLDAKEAPTMSHAFFSNGLKASLMSLFSTHPPLDQRIKSIDPDWKGPFPKITKEMKGNLKDDFVPVFTSGVPVTSSKLIDTVGQFGADNIERARKSLASMPVLIKQNIYSIDGARAVFYGLLMADFADRVLLNKQLTYLEDNTSKETIVSLNKMLYVFHNLSFDCRIPLIEIALPQLRYMSAIEYQKFQTNLKWLIKSDEKVSIFEWFIEKRVHHYLKSEFEGADYKTVKYRSLKAVKTELDILMSMLCIHYVDEKERAGAINVSREILGITNLEMLPSAELTMDKFSGAVDNLALLSPELKEKVIKFCYNLVTRDADYSIEEQETMRVLSECLGCPMPISSKF